MMLITNMLMLILIFPWKAFAEDNDSCIYNKFCSEIQNPPHSCCKPKPGKHCRVLTEDLEHFRDVMVNSHNEFRSKIAMGKAKVGSAAKMFEVAYDSGLEDTATCHMNKCKFRHDTCRSTERFRKVGQNIYTSIKKGLKDENYREAVKSWYSEIQWIKRTDIEEFPEKPSNTIGHFSQLIWWSVTHIGCVRTFNRKRKAKFHFYILCNYAGIDWSNLVGAEIYKSGPTCSECPDDRPCSEPTGLCKLEEQISLRSFNDSHFLETSESTAETVPSGKSNGSGTSSCFLAMLFSLLVKCLSALTFHYSWAFFLK